MPTPTKERIVSETSRMIKGSQAVYLTDFLGMNVEQVNRLRAKLFASGIRMSVVKNTLISRSVKEAGYDFDISNYLKGATALVYGIDDPVEPAKILTEAKKSNKDLGKPDVKAVIFQGNLFGKEKVEAIAALPSKDELIAKLLATLASPMTTLVRTLKAPMSNLVNGLNQLKEKKE